jgi:hypothetical protein
MTTVTTQEDRRPIRSMEVDELQRRANDVLKALPEGLSEEWVEWMGDKHFYEPDLFNSKEERQAYEDDLRIMFWVAVKVTLRDLIAHDVDVRLPHKD